ncbi:MAG: hypothetical protein R3F59_12940 [Myxococcota bacterium]
MQRALERSVRIGALLAAGAWGHDALAFCTPGEVWTCYANGQYGWKTCGSNGMFGPCEVPTPPPRPSAKVRADYKVLTVVYAPPGRQGGANSSVSYGSGSTLGSTTSLSDSFSQSTTVGVKLSQGLLTSVGGSFTYGRESSDTEATEIKKASTTTIAMGGPAVDGVDHDRDQIWLWLGPRFDLAMPDDHTVEWSVDPTATMELQYVYVGDLKNPAQMPPGVAAALAAHGITADDYPDILDADPLADGSDWLDPQRYAPVNLTFPYQPPYAPGDPSPTLTFQSTFAETNSTTHTSKHSYTVSISWETGFDLASLQAKVSNTNAMTFSDQYSKTTATSVSEAATVTVGGPAYGYTGPTQVAVYYDTLYKTFAFVPLDPGTLPFATGYVVVDDWEDPAGREVVAYDDAGTPYRAISDADGRFELYGAPSGAARFGFEQPIVVDGPVWPSE